MPLKVVWREHVNNPEGLGFSELLYSNYMFFVSIATNFMTYHTILKTSKDFYEALRWSRQISEWLTEKLQNGSSSDIRVFPYRFVIKLWLLLFFCLVSKYCPWSFFVCKKLFCSGLVC